MTSESWNYMTPSSFQVWSKKLLVMGKGFLEHSLETAEVAWVPSGNLEETGEEGSS